MKNHTIRKVLLFIGGVILLAAGVSGLSHHGSAPSAARVATTVVNAPTTPVKVTPGTVKAPAKAPARYISLTMGVGVLNAGWLYNYNVANVGGVAGTPRCTTLIALPGEPTIGPFPDPGGALAPGQTQKRYGAIRIPRSAVGWAGLVTPVDVSTECSP